MKTRVTAVVVARQGGEHLAATMTALTQQTLKPDVVIAVDNSPKHVASSQFKNFGAAQILTGSAKLSFGESLELARKAFPAASQDSHLLWFLAQDSAPTPTALAELVAALEVSPSVVAVGPKQMDWDRPDYIRECGLTLSQGGRTISLVTDELDQGQHDYMSDVLAVGGNGMLVRQDVWLELEGFDPYLRVVDDALDFCVRARLAGHRIAVVPSAKVLNAGDGVIGAVGTDTQRARTKRARQYRTAELYRRLVYCSSLSLWWHWLGLVPLAILRALGQLLAKRPGAVTGEFRAAFAAAFSGGSVGKARSRLKRQRTSPWSAIDPLRMSRAEVRRREALAREARQVRLHGEKQPLYFFSRGGAWVVLALVFVSVGAFSPLVGAPALSGGALLPMGTSLSDLWSQTGWGLREGAFALVGPADAFAYVMALLGTATFWQPSLSLVVIWFLAMPLSGLTAWLMAARLTQRAGIRALIAIGYGLSPALLAGLHEGRPAAVITHFLLPLLVFTGITAIRSWSASATTALIFAVIVACSPSLTPALLIMWVGTLFLTGRYVGRFIAIPIPAAVLVAPTVIMQIVGINVFALAADPGPVAQANIAPPWQMAMGFATEGFGGWSNAASFLPWADPIASVWVLVLVGVLAALAVVGLFSQYPIRAQLSALVVVLGVATAVFSTSFSVTFAGSITAPIWPGAGLSLAWLGLLVAAGTGASILKRFSFYPAVVATVIVVLLAIPSLTASHIGQSRVIAGSGQTLPAYVVAQASNNPKVGTLVLSAQPDGGLASYLVRGEGMTMSSISTTFTTGLGFSDSEKQVATTVANLASDNSQNVTDELKNLGIGFIVLAPSTAVLDEKVSIAASTRAANVKASLDSNPQIDIVGETDAGFLWMYPGYEQSAVVTPETALPVEPFRSALWTIQGLVLLLTLLLAIPTGSVMVDARPKRYIPGLVESEDDHGVIDPLSGEQDDEQN